MQENLLTTDQVARYLRVDKFTVYRLVARRNMIEDWLNRNINTDAR